MENLRGREMCSLVYARAGSAGINVALIRKEKARKVVKARSYAFAYA